MEIGPFQVAEIERIQELFNSKNIGFEMFIDEELKEKVLKEFHQGATMNPRGMSGQLDLRIVFFTLEDGDYAKVSADLEKYGIAAPSDGSYELSED